MKNKNFILANATMNPGPSVSEYVKSIKKILKKEIFYFKRSFCSAVDLIKDSRFIFLSVLKINHPFSPVRIKKLVNSNNVVSSYAREENNYSYIYDLDSALDDWKKNVLRNGK